VVPTLFIILAICYALYRFGSPSPNVDDDDQEEEKEVTKGKIGLAPYRKKKGRVTEEGQGSEQMGLLNEEDEEEYQEEKVSRGKVGLRNSSEAWGLEDDEEEDGNLSQISIASRNGQISPSSRDRSSLNPNNTLSNSTLPRTPSKLSKHSYSQSSPQNSTSNMFRSHSSSNSLSSNHLNQDTNDPSNSDSPWRAVNLSSTKRGAIGLNLNPSSSNSSISSPIQDRKIAGTKAKSAQVAPPPAKNISGSKKGD